MSVTFLEPSGSNLLTADIPQTSRNLKLTVTRNNAPWINSNYPEAVGAYGTNLSLAEYGYYVNQQRVKGDAEIFYSHTNHTGKTLKFRIHIYNCSASTVTVKRTNMGYSSGWTTPADAVKGYFAGNGQNFTLASGASAWLTPEYSITGNGNTPFTGMVHFNASNDIIVTEYMYYNASAVKGTEKAYPFNTNSKVYTGIGTGYFITFNHKSAAADRTKVSSLAKQPYIYTVNDPDINFTNNNEMVPIKILGTNETAQVGGSYGNIGNWGAHNYHVIKFTNDTSQKAVIYGYIASNLNSGNTQVINRGGVIKSARLNRDTGKRQWKWCKVELNPEQSEEFDFQQIVASYGDAASVMKWELE